MYGAGGHGLVTGYKSGVFVIDTDGAEADARFRALGDLPETYTVTTPSGGRHYYFAWPGFPVATTQGKIDQKPEEKTSNIDVRGDVNGFVVMPGSPHRSGRAYEVEKNVAPAHAPTWILEMPCIRGASVETCSGRAPVPVDTTTPEGQRRVKLGREACETFPAEADGTGGVPLFNLALRLIRDLELPLESATELITHVYNPRCTKGDGTPYPWSGEEIEHKLHDAREKSDRPCGIFSEDFGERLLACSRQRHLEAAALESGRRIHDPAHRYSVLIGQQSTGEPAKTQPHEARSILWSHPDWDGVFAFDELRGEVVAVDPPTPLDAEKLGLSDEDGDRISNWFAVCEMPMSVLPDIAYRAARVVAKRRSFNPIREYLQGLVPVWGSIEAMATDAMGLTDPIELTYVRKFMIAAVRRALKPGDKADNMLVLHGAPGLKKSTFVNELFTDEWSSDSVGNIEDEKGVGEKLSGKWCVELAELKSVQAAGLETVLAFLSRRTDRFRGAYARGNAKDHPRTCVFVGTTNETDILRNASGADARRFWIVKPTKKIDTDWIRANRDDVWGEAYALAMAGELHYLAEDEEIVHYAHVEQFQARDPWHDAIVRYCAGRSDGVTIDEVARSLGVTTEKLDRRTMLRITDTFRRERFTDKQVGKARARKWFPPEHIAAAEPAVVLAAPRPLRAAG